MMMLDISEPDDPRLGKFYDLYQRIFVLEEEREPLDGFRTILGFNRDQAVQAEFGPLFEQIAVAFEPSTGAAIGLANYILYAFPGHGDAPNGFNGSCQLNFLCVDETYRGTGVAGLLLDHIDRQLHAFIVRETGTSNPLGFITIEQNNPARMTPEQRRADLEAAKIDPDRRLRWWARKGYRRLDFPYQQPPLSPDVDACTYLDYYARVPGDSAHRTSAIPANILADHLRRFFFVSVDKFASDMRSNPEWLKQKDHLSRLAEIGFTEVNDEGS